MYYVYFLRSIKDGKYYIGYTSQNPTKRLKEHNSGMVASTKKRRPFKLVYIEKYLSQGDAYKREWYLKHPRGYLDKCKIIDNLDL